MSPDVLGLVIAMAIGATGFGWALSGGRPRERVNALAELANTQREVAVQLLDVERELVRAFAAENSRLRRELASYSQAQDVTVEVGQ